MSTKVCALCPNWQSIETSPCGNCELHNRLTVWLSECSKRYNSIILQYPKEDEDP